MFQALYPAPRPQSIGEVLDTTFRIFRISLLKCLPFGFLAMLAGQLQSIYDLVTGHPLRHFGSGDPVWWALYGIGTLVTLTMWSAVIVRQRALAEGAGGISWTADLLLAVRRLPHVVALLVLSALAVGLGLLLVVPGVYLVVAVLPAWHALLIEERGPVRALVYSVRLVTGNWWRVLVTFLIALTILIVFYAIAAIVVAAAAPLTGADLATITALSTVVVVALGALSAPFFCALLLAILGDLQARREGVDLERRLSATAPQ